MGAKIFSNTQRSTMCGLKKLASGVFPESWKVLAERRRRHRTRKRTKNNKSPGYPGWLNKTLFSSDKGLASGSKPFLKYYTVNVMSVNGLVMQAVSASHCNGVIISAMAFQIPSLTIVSSTVCSRCRSKKTSKSPVNSPHKWPITRKMFPFDDVIMIRYGGTHIYREFTVSELLHCTNGLHDTS